MILNPKAWWTYLRSSGDNFHTVVPGQLYRGATPEPANLKKWHAKYGLKTWIDLRMPKDWKGDEAFFNAQCATARYQGITRVSLPLDDFGVVSDEQIAVFLELVAQASEDNPVLFGCKGNRHRGSLVCAVYRMRIMGWTKAQAMDEAHECGYYRHGHERFDDRFMGVLDQIERARK